jgi:uncharacterized membrane protein YtjA (UPF0391 family)
LLVDFRVSIAPSSQELEPPANPGRFSLAANLREASMPGNLIYYALALIVIALVAALLGFGGVASTAMGGAHLLIWVAVVIIVIGVVIALIRRR